MTLRSRAVDAVFGVLELLASLYDTVRKLRTGRYMREAWRAGAADADRTAPIPLTRRARK